VGGKRKVVAGWMAMWKSGIEFLYFHEQKIVKKYSWTGEALTLSIIREYGLFIQWI
jgi:hypothetical protein